MTENIKGKEEKYNLYRQMKIRCYQKKKDYEMFCMNFRVAPKHKSRSDMKHKKEETEENIRKPPN